MDKHVTVALCVYNGEAFVKEAVESILAQDHDVFDLYVVDDASDDNTFEIVLPLIQADPRAHLLRLSRNVGTYAAKNLVLSRYCNGTFFAHQDADDFSHPARLSSQIQFLIDHPGIAACGTAIDEFFASDNDAPAIPGDAPIVFNEEDGCFHRENVYPARLVSGEYYSAPPEALAKIKLAMNGSLMFRRQVLAELGGFDGHTHIAGDTELLWRLLCRWDLANLSDVLYSRRFHSGSLTRSAAVGFSSSRRRAYIEGVRWRMLESARQDSDKIITHDFHFSDVDHTQYD